jgi:endonuclease YncB( thermonuclease family)
MMESTRQKTFKLRGIILSESVVSLFILLLSPAHSTADHPGQFFSQAVFKLLADVILNKSVKIKADGTDRYGRTLGVVYCKGTNVNLEMIKAGLAGLYSGKPERDLITI